MKVAPLEPVHVEFSDGGFVYANEKVSGWL